MTMSWWHPGHVTTVHIWEGTLEGNSKGRAAEPPRAVWRGETANSVTPPEESITLGNIDYIFVLY